MSYPPTHFKPHMSSHFLHSNLMGAPEDTALVPEDGDGKPWGGWGTYPEAGMGTHPDKELPTLGGETSIELDTPPPAAARTWVGGPLPFSLVDPFLLEQPVLRALITPPPPTPPTTIILSVP